MSTAVGKDRVALLLPGEKVAVVPLSFSGGGVGEGVAVRLVLLSETTVGVELGGGGANAARGRVVFCEEVGFFCIIWEVNSTR